MKLLHQSDRFVDAVECDVFETGTAHFAAIQRVFNETPPSSEPRVMRSLGSVDECGCMALMGRFLMWASRNAT